MPKNDKRVKITLECTECKHRNYITMKSKINDRERLEMKKYCNHDRRTRSTRRPADGSLARGTPQSPPVGPPRAAGSLASPSRGQ